MTKKHFEAAALYIREHLAGPEHAAAVELIVHLGQRHNGRFDEQRFRAACGDGQKLARQSAARASA